MNTLKLMLVLSFFVYFSAIKCSAPAGFRAAAFDAINDAGQVIVIKNMASAALKTELEKSRKELEKTTKEISNKQQEISTISQKLEKLLAKNKNEKFLGQLNTYDTYLHEIINLEQAFEGLEKQLLKLHAEYEQTIKKEKNKTMKKNELTEPLLDNSVEKELSSKEKIEELKKKMEEKDREITYYTLKRESLLNTSTKDLYMVITLRQEKKDTQETLDEMKKRQFELQHFIVGLIQELDARTQHSNLKNQGDQSCK